MKYRGRKDRGRYVETWWYHPKTGRGWRDMANKPHLYRDEAHMKDDLLSVEIRFQKDEGLFFVDLHNNTTITEESLRTLRHKLEAHINTDAKMHDDDWKEMILVTNYSEDDTNVIGVGFDRVGVKGDFYRHRSADGKKLRGRMESKAGCHFIAYTDARWKMLRAMTEASERLRSQYWRIMLAVGTDKFDKRFLKFCADVEAAFKGLTRKQQSVLL